MKRQYKQAIKDWTNDHLEDEIVQPATTKARQHPDMLASWMKYCNVNTPEEIDYENPNVFIEWWLCDANLYNLALDDPKTFCEQTGSDYELFMKEYAPIMPTREDRAKELKRQMRKALNPFNKKKHH